MGYRLIGQVILLIFGLWWCKEIFGRLRSDIAVLRESSDAGHKGVIIFFWIVTLVIIALIVYFAWGIISRYF